jgi:hypothetical protein
VPCVEVSSFAAARQLRSAPRAVCWLVLGSLALAQLGCQHLPKPGPGATRPEPKAQVSPAGLPAPATPRSLEDLRLQAARRLVAANPGISYTSKPPDVLLAIPVLTVELNADGSIRRIEVMRYPRQARDTVDIATQAVRRAAPFGNVSRLPKPWKFNETFLFNDQRKFKPMTLDQ